MLEEVISDDDEEEKQRILSKKGGKGRGKKVGVMTIENLSFTFFEFVQLF